MDQAPESHLGSGWRFSMLLSCRNHTIASVNAENNFGAERRPRGVLCLSI